MPNTDTKVQPGCACKGPLARAVERRYPPIGTFATVDGVRCHYLDRGHGRPVVMVHGATSNLREWTASIFDAIASRHRAIAIDRPGAGFSQRIKGDGYGLQDQVRLLRRLLDTIGAERPVLVGHSFGGAVVLAHALAYPERTGGILVLAGVTHPWRGGIGRVHELAMLPVIGRLYANTVIPLLFPWRAPGAISRVFAPDPVPETYYERAAVELSRRPETFLANARDLTALKPLVRTMAPRYHMIEAPLIALTGDSDAVVQPLVHTPPLVDKVKRGRAVLLEGVGHMPHHVRPEAVLAAVDELVAALR